MSETPQQEQFRVLYEAHYPRILGYALRRTASAEDAADVVSETFTTAWRRFADMPPGEEATLWLYGVARRVLSNHHRKRESRGAVLESLAREYEEAVGPDPTVGVSGVSPRVSQAWAALKADDRDLLGLLVWETLTAEQIAAVVGCPRAVVKVRIHRARKRFARELERRGVAVSGYAVRGSTKRGGSVKPPDGARHVQVGRADALPDTEAMR